LPCGLPPKHPKNQCSKKRLILPIETDCVINPEN